MSLHVIRKVGWGIANHGYRRKVKEQVVGDNLGKELQKDFSWGCCHITGFSFIIHYIAIQVQENWVKIRPHSCSPILAWVSHFLLWWGECLFFFFFKEPDSHDCVRKHRGVYNSNYTTTQPHVLACTVCITIGSHLIISARVKIKVTSSLLQIQLNQIRRFSRFRNASEEVMFCLCYIFCYNCMKLYHVTWWMKSFHSII